jgi:hypothetical protein
MFPGGAKMHDVVSAAIASGDLVPVRKFNERLYTRRLTRKFRDTRVYILQLKPDSPPSTRG